MIVFAYACLRNELETLAAHRPAVGDVPTPDEIHKMRIATRRLRVALRLFKEMLPTAARTLKHELRWFSHTLGKARDLDVYMDGFRAYMQRLATPEAQDLTCYERHLEIARTAARHDVAALFCDARYERLLASFAIFLEEAPPPAALRRWRSFRVVDGAQSYLEESAKRLLKHGGKIDSDSSPEQLHRLRIEAKRLRYELEFFAAVYAPLDKSAKAARRLQDTLGEYQDACTAMQRVRDFVDGDAAPTALARLMQTHERNAADARLAFATEWRRFKKSFSLDALRNLLAA